MMMSRKDAVEARSRLVRHLRGPHPKLWGDHINRPPRIDPDTHPTWWAAWVETAPIYWADETATAHARRAAKSHLPATHHTQDRLLAPTGLLVFQTSPTKPREQPHIGTTFTFDGAAWTALPEGLWVELLERADTGNAHPSVAARLQEAGPLLPWQGLLLPWQGLLLPWHPQLQLVARLHTHDGAATIQATRATTATILAGKPHFTPPPTATSTTRHHLTVHHTPQEPVTVLTGPQD